MNFKKGLSLLLALVMLLGLAACQNTQTTNPSTTVPGNPGDEIVKFEGDYIYKDAVVQLSSNWNPHTYQTSDQSYPIDWITSSLYTFMYNDELHPVEGKNPYEGYVIVPEMAASEPVDVTEQVKAEHPEFNIPANMTSGYAYTIDLNPDAKFDNGKPITAETYVESMKRLLDPKLQNYRAEIVTTGDFILSNATNYLFQGTSKYVDDGSIDLSKVVKMDDGNYATPNGEPIYIAVNYEISYLGNTLGAYVNAYGDTAFSTQYWAELSGMADENGLVPLNDTTLPMITDVITGNSNWGEDESYLPKYMVYFKEYEANYDFAKVGLYASGEYQITFVLENALSGFYLIYSSGSLTLPLVDIELYDSCLQENDGVWSSTYGTSVETTVGYGPYKMAEYQRDKSMRFVRNDSWFGYTDGKHIYVDPTDGKTYPMYQTTEIQTRVVPESATRKLMFLAGELMGYGLQAEDFEQYRSSEFVHATPGQAIYFLILNGHMDQIQAREAAEDFDKSTKDLETMTLNSFRRAMAVSIDKDLFAATISPARSGGYGIVGTAYIYDVDAGARYRDTDQAKQILCDVYSVDVSKYESLDAAVDSITGYDPVAAKELYQECFQEALEKGYITDSNNDGISDQTVEITYAISAASEFQTKTINYLNEKIAEVTAGTGFADKIKIVESAPVGDAWSDRVKEGVLDTVLGGWNGSALNPFSLTDLYTNPDKAYDGAWFDANTVDLTLNVNVSGKDGKDMQDVTMTLRQWSLALNGTAIEIGDKTYNFGDGQTDIDTRLAILAGIEGAVLRTYNYLPMLQDGSMALLSQQVYYVVEEYNPIMGRGGVAYMKYNYEEAEWLQFVAENDRKLTY